MTHPTPTHLSPTHLLDLIGLRGLHTDPRPGREQTLHATSAAGPVTVTVTPRAEGFDLTATGPHLQQDGQPLIRVRGEQVTAQLTHPLLTAQFGPLGGEDTLTFTAEDAQASVDRYLQRRRDAGTHLSLSAALPLLRAAVRAAGLDLDDTGEQVTLSAADGQAVPLEVYTSATYVTLVADDVSVVRTTVTSAPFADPMENYRRGLPLRPAVAGTTLNLTHPRVTQALDVPTLIEPDSDDVTVHGRDERGLLVVSGQRFFTGEVWETLNPDLNRVEQAVRALRTAERARAVQGGFYLTSHALLVLGDGVSVLPLSALDAART